MNGLHFRTSEFRFRDRRDAGKALAKRLAPYAATGQSVVLALPRGGVPVGDEVARALGAPLDVFLVRKLGLPGHAELAMGAIASGGVRVLNDDVVDALQVPESVIDKVVRWEEHELERRERAYRGGKPPIPIEGRTVLLVDDGLATGATMRAAVRAIRGHRPSRIVVAVPVASRDTCRALRSEADDVICAYTPEPFHAVGLWYEDFTPTTDDEVIAHLSRARRETS